MATRFRKLPSGHIVDLNDVSIFYPDIDPVGDKGYFMPIACKSRDDIRYVYVGHAYKTSITMMKQNMEFIENELTN